VSILFQLREKVSYLYPVHLLVIPMYICTSQSLFSHSYVVNERLNRHCNVQIDIGIRADELDINPVSNQKCLWFFPKSVGKKIPGHVCIATVIEFQANFSIITPYLPYKVARLSACLSCTVPGYIDG
jgi:hypothetical protein